MRGNRLTQVKQFAEFASISGSPDLVVDYLYDVENRWIGENIDGNGDGVVDHQIRFAYDGNQIVLQFEAGGQSDLIPNPQSLIPLLTHRYLWQPNAVDQLMADEQLLPSPASGRGAGGEGGEGQGEGGEGQGEGYDVASPGTVVWPLGDNLGTIRDLAVTENGETSVVNHRVYDSYGNLKLQTGAVDCLFGFTGRALDSNTGLQNNLNRWYDASAGRWMSKDPIGFYGGQSNVYVYCGNSPTNATDPSGLERIPGVPSILPSDPLLPNGVPSLIGTIELMKMYDAHRIEERDNAIAGIMLGMMAGGSAYFGGAAIGSALAGASVTSATSSLGIGSQAIVAKGLGAGVWPALLINGQVYVARFHQVAWDMANRGDVQKYGMAIIDEFGRVIGWK